MKRLTQFSSLRDLTSDVAAVVLLSAAWCGPCKVITPIFEKLSEDVRGVIFYYADIDEVPDLARVLDVRSVPFVVAISDGAVRRASPCGGWRKDKFLEWVRAAVPVLC